MAEIDANPAPAPNEEAALARGVLFEALALGFQPPTRETLERIESHEGRQTLALAAEAADPEDASGLSAAVSGLTGLRREPLVERAVRHSQLFGHTARGPVCPYETEYGTGALFRQPQELAHIAGYYAAFGLRPRAVVGERVDHVACECAFAGFLSRKEAFVLSGISGGPASPEAHAEMLETTRKATRSFLKDHLGRFGTSFGLRLSREDGRGFYGSLAEVLVALLRRESERLGVALGPATLDLRPSTEDDVPMVCGTGEELVQIQTRRNAGSGGG